ncbi:hypothetical protein MHH60_31705 [Paenibacillus sp. FSL H7-0716]|uniref:hypothetical protein n=1 Tax=Paenibacillus TaxID=44249 RepID=UPI00117D965E|nr:hypothetical protein [Paenibacillus odorifer]
MTIKNLAADIELFSHPVEELFPVLGISMSILCSQAGGNFIFGYATLAIIFLEILNDRKSMLL